MTTIDMNIFLPLGQYEIFGIASDAFFVKPAVFAARLAVSGHPFYMEKGDFVFLKIEKCHPNIKNPMKQGHDIVEFHVFDIVIKQVYPLRLNMYAS